MSLLAIAVYILAIGIPVYLLYHFHSSAWYWHVLAIVIALALGFVPTPAEYKSTTFDLMFGGVFIFLMVWGIGGLIVFRPHHEKHA
jgi:hypothetical protein